MPKNPIIFIGNVPELLDVVKDGGRGDISTLCHFFSNNSYCHNKRQHLPDVLTPHNAGELTDEQAILQCGMDCGHACHATA
jgi:hypothetical protein